MKVWSSMTFSCGLVPIATPPKLVSPMRPFTLPPARIGTSCSSIEANPAAEVGDHILAETETEREDVVALDEEGALLREEQREPRQVRSTRVDLCFSEVCVHGRGREDVRAEPLVDVEARLKIAFDARVR